MTTPPIPSPLPPNRQPPGPVRPPDRAGLTRREMLALLGLVGGATALTCACGSTLALVALLNGDDEAGEDAADLAQISPTAEPLPNFVYPLMLGRAAWGAQPVNNSAPFESGFYSDLNPSGWRRYGDDLREFYNTVVVHHSVIYEGDDPATMREIQRAHQIDRGWADVGYHYVIGKNGAVYEGRDIFIRGTHVSGHNTGTVGVCLMGNFMSELPTDSQIDSARDLLQWLASTLQLSHIATHRDFNETTQCPGDNLAVFTGAFALNAGLEVGIEGYVPPESTATATACACCTCTGTG